MNFQFNHKQTNTYWWARIEKKDDIFNKIRKDLKCLLLLVCQNIGYMNSKGRFEQTTELLF